MDNRFARPPVPEAPSLADSMFDYLIRQIAAAPDIDVHCWVQVALPGAFGLVRADVRYVGPSVAVTHVVTMVTLATACEARETMVISAPNHTIGGKRANYT